jgi:uncharacterized protein
MSPLRYAWTLLLALLVAALFAAPASAQLKPVPALTGRVVDEVGMLDASQRQRLTAVLADYEAKTGSQIAVLLVKSTEPEAIEQYSIRVTDAWHLGRKGVDDGVLLMVARDNPKALRRLRIEAGRGVQGVLTDAQSKRILQDVIAPYFQRNQFYEGLVAGVGALETTLNKEKFPAPAQQRPVQPQRGNGGGLLVPLFFVFIGFALIASFFRGRRGGRGSGMGGQTLSHSSWGSGATGFILGNILSDMTRRQHGGSDGGFGGGFGGGGFSGGDGGGFSGGGGNFDGGGASGDW